MDKSEIELWVMGITLCVLCFACGCLAYQESFPCNCKVSSCEVTVEKLCGTSDCVSVEATNEVVELITGVEVSGGDFGDGMSISVDELKKRGYNLNLKWELKK